MLARKTKLAAAVAVVAVLVALLWMLRPSPHDTAPASKATQAAATGASAPAATSSAFSTTAQATPGLSDEEKAMLRSFQERFGPKLQNRSVQVHMLEKLIRYYREKDPEHWREAVLRALLAGFPDRYAELAANLQHWIDYEQWMKDNQGYLQTLGEKERRAALMEERSRLFGKDAAEEIWASELKNQAFSDALKAIDAAPNTTVGDKLAKYKESIEDLYQEKSERYLEQHAQEAMNRFLDLESVQQQLTEMTPEERSKNLREIRKGMGLDEAALQRWDALDQERDARWDTGARYMKERATLERKFSGVELEDKVRELRGRYFGAEAEIIGQEEQSGFFRFNRPRKWGRN